MIEQVSLSIIFIFLFIIALCVVVLLLVTPKAVGEYKGRIRRQSQSGVKISNSENKGMSVYMEELSNCSDEGRIQKLLNLIKEEVQNIHKTTDSKIQLKQADSVKIWLDHFSVSEHIHDIKRLKVSRQIVFDMKKKDFKLMVIK